VCTDSVRATFLDRLASSSSFARPGNGNTLLMYRKRSAVGLLRPFVFPGVRSNNVVDADDDSVKGVACCDESILSFSPRALAWEISFSRLTIRDSMLSRAPTLLFRERRPIREFDRAKDFFTFIHRLSVSQAVCSIDGAMGRGCSHGRLLLDVGGTEDEIPALRRPSTSEVVDVLPFQSSDLRTNPDSSGGHE
jgi:hypothetical protein